MIPENAPCYHDISTRMTITTPPESYQSSSLTLSSSCDSVRPGNTTSTTDNTDNTDDAAGCGGPAHTTSLSNTQLDILKDDDHLIIGLNKHMNTSVDSEMNSPHKNHCIYTFICRCCRGGCNSNAFTDEQLLILAFLSFLTFAIVQMIFAIYVAHSHAMIGDSSVMLLDAMTYLFNGFSERRKQYYYTQYQIQIQQSPPQKLGEQPLDEPQLTCSKAILDSHDDPSTAIVNEPALAGTVDDDDAAAGTTIQHDSIDNEEPEQDILLLRLRQRVILLEIVAPSISVAALIIVTTVVTRQAIHTIQTIESTTTTTTSQPNLYIILFFSIFNLLLDGINMYFFTRPKFISICCSTVTSLCVCSCGQRFRRPTTIRSDMNDGMTDQDMTDFDHHNGVDRSIDTIILKHQQNNNHMYHQHTTQPSSDVISTAPIPSMAGNQSSCSPEESLHHNHTIKQYHPSHSRFSTTPSARKTKSLPTNMNMCSAYTHVLADTLRSIAVITAVLLALYNDIEPALADATAALIVSFLIALSLIPLLQGLYHNMYELYNVRLQLQQLNQIEFPNSPNIEFEESNHSNSTIV